MNNPPSPYPGAEPGQEDQTQESQMLYSYPEQEDQMQGAGVPYGYPHAAGFPQPGYPPTQPIDAQAQPGYAGLQQAGFIEPQFPSYARWGKSWNGLWIALTVFVLFLLVAGGSLYYYLQIRSTPEKTLQNYCNAIKSDDAQALYNTYSSEARDQIDEAHLQRGLRVIDFFSGGIEDCSVDTASVRENDPHASADVTFTLANGDVNSARLHLIDENGAWKVENNAILP